MCMTYSCTWSSVSMQRKGRNSWRERKSALCLGSTSSIPVQVGLDRNKSWSGLRNPLQAGSEHPLEPDLDSLINSFHGSVEMQLWSGSASVIETEPPAQMWQWQCWTAAWSSLCPQKEHFSFVRPRLPNAMLLFSCLGEFVCQKS